MLDVVEDQGPRDATIRDVANALLRGRGVAPSRGRAVFLVGAGCSVSAGIPPASGVAKHCAIKLAKDYSAGKFAGDADAALTWLQRKKDLNLSAAQKPNSEGFHWGNLYSYFFEEHFIAPMEQSEIINDIIEKAGDKINWAHACLGELVCERFVHTVITTNFDQLVLQGIVRAGMWPVLADGLESMNRILGTPKRPQVVHLHGSMNTYNTLNSRADLAAPEKHTGAVSMIHSLLHESKVLVVAGYRGGEEGVMNILCDAAKKMPQLVIYWVTYEGGVDLLSDNCRKLLSGGNKFIVSGGDADKFFGDLMEELELGQPKWVKDPITALCGDSEKLVVAEGNELDAAKKLIWAYKERIKFASRIENRWKEDDELKLRAVESWAEGDYIEALSILSTKSLEIDKEAKRLHALVSQDLYDSNPEGNASYIETAVVELSELVLETEGDARLANVMSLMDALLDLSDVQEGEKHKDNSALKQVVKQSDRWQKEFPCERYPLEWAQLSLRRAQAKQALAEGETDDIPLLKEARLDYDEALNGLAQANAGVEDLLDAKAGLGAVLHVLGESCGGDNTDLREAIRIFKEVVEQSRTRTGREEDAGPLFNLSGPLVSLARVVPLDERQTLLDQAETALTTAIRIYEREGDRKQIETARERLEEVLGLRQEEDYH